MKAYACAKATVSVAPGTLLSPGNMILRCFRLFDKDASRSRLAAPVLGGFLDKPWDDIYFKER